MDSRLEINEPIRAGTSETLATTPLIAIAWRLMKTQCRRLAAEREVRAGQTAGMQAALAELAALAYRLRKTNTAVENAAPTPCGPNPIAGQMEAALGKAGVRLVAPEGAPYTAELMDILENVAPFPKADITGPEVMEVVQPAILQGGDLLQMGKAVIAVPAPPDAPTDRQHPDTK